MQKKFTIENLGCANCASKMERVISKIEGVQSVSINFMTRKMILEADEEKIQEITRIASEKIRRIERQAELKES